MPRGQKRRNCAVFTTLHEDRVPGSWHEHSVFPWAESGKARRQKRGNNNHHRLVTETDCSEGEREKAWPAWGDWRWCLVEMAGAKGSTTGDCGMPTFTKPNEFSIWWLGGGLRKVQLLWNKTASRNRFPFLSISPHPLGTAELRIAIARSKRESQRVIVEAKARDLPRTASETAELADRDREHKQARTWMKASILPLNSLRLKMERGLDFRILWGLGGRVGGLGTWSASYDWYRNCTY